MSTYGFGNPAQDVLNERIALAESAEDALVFSSGVAVITNAILSVVKKRDEMINISYTAFLLDEKPVAGMYKMLEEMGDMPSHWLPYFAVEDCDQTSAKAQDMGATVLQLPTDIPETGRFSVLMDPQGAAFAIIKMEPMEE